jgi:tetratricopeptide (TPR) repeat protein
LVSAQKSLELDAESPEAHNLIGYIHQAEGRSEDAIEHYRQAIAIDETYVEAMLNAAEVLIHALDDSDAGLELVEEALDFAEGDDEIADALMLKFDALMQRGEREAAAKLLSNIPDGPFENEQLDLVVGRAKFELSDLDGAEKYLSRAASRPEPAPDVHYYAGLVHEARGDHRGATLAFLAARAAELKAPRPSWSLSPSAFEQRAQGALRKLPPELAQLVEDALVVVSDVPGPEVVAEGVDPHVGVLLDDLRTAAGTPAAADAKPARVGRVFVYQRNVERSAPSVADVEDEILRALEHELGLSLSEPR